MHEADDGPMVAAAAISHRYGDRVALAGVSFTVPRGAVVGLVGANGSGKSTLLRIIAGATTPSSGTISVAGHDLAVAESNGTGVGAAIDGMALWPAWTVERNLRYLGGLAGAGPEAVNAAAHAAGISHELRTKLRRLSLGNRQRVAIAAAILCGTRLVLLDEPMNGLDPDGRRATRDLIVELGGQGRTVVFSSHDLHDVETICRSVIVLDRGRVVFTGPVEEYAQQLFVVGLGVAERDVDRAASELTRAGLRHWIDRSRRLVVDVDDEPDAERALRSAGIELSGGDRRPATLEERFDARS